MAHFAQIARMGHSLSLLSRCLRLGPSKFLVSFTTWLRLINIAYGEGGRSLLYETPAVYSLTGLGESIHFVSVLDSVAGPPSVIGGRATTTISLAPARELTSRLPPSWRSLSRIPLRPTPGLFDNIRLEGRNCRQSSRVGMDFSTSAALGRLRTAHRLKPKRCSGVGLVVALRRLSISSRPLSLRGWRSQRSVGCSSTVICKGVLHAGTPERPISDLPSVPWRARAAVPHSSWRRLGRFQACRLLDIPSGPKTLRQAHWHSDWWVSCR